MKARVCAFILMVVAFLVGCEKDLIPASRDAQPSWTSVRGPLVATRWSQEGSYAALTPNHQALGCWSVAFAQIVAFHRLTPKGRVHYTTRGGKVVDESLSPPIQWEKVVTEILPETSSESAHETARLCYYLAVIVQKDFGRDEYVDIARLPEEIAGHCSCIVRKVESGLNDQIVSELRANRPVEAYFDDILNINVVRNGHAAVIDGTAENNGRLMLHVNPGWGGASDGWYDFVLLSRERDLRALYLISPIV
jgi:hypothetical protein